MTVALALVGLATVAAPAGADWLVRRDGTTLETAGAWQVAAGQVRFRSAVGKPQVVPEAELDLAASARLTRERAAARPRPAGLAAAAAAARAARLAQRPAVAAIDDRDVGRADPAAIAGAAAAPPAPGEPVVLYSTSWCGWCRKTKQLLASLGVPFEERDVERSAAARAEKDRLAPGSGVPVLARGTRVVQGHDPAGIRALVRDLATGG